MSETTQEVFNVSANLFRGMESVGGKMKITNTELKFEPNKVNVQKGPLSININDIKEVEKKNTLLLVPNGLKVTVNSGEEYKFVVNNRGKIMDYLNSQIEK